MVRRADAGADAGADTSSVSHSPLAQPDPKETQRLFSLAFSSLFTEMSFRKAHTWELGSQSPTSSRTQPNLHFPNSGTP